MMRTKHLPSTPWLLLALAGSVLVIDLFRSFTGREKSAGLLPFRTVLDSGIAFLLAYILRPHRADAAGVDRARRRSGRGPADVTWSSPLAMPRAGL